MKIKIKSFIVILLVLFLLPLFGCEQVTEEKVILPDLTGMTRTEISKNLDNLGIKYSFQFSNIPCYDDTYYDKFVEYGSGYTAGKEISKEKFITVYTTPLHLDLSNLDKLKLEASYQGKSFIDDGIGEVKLVYSIDGDTARFIDPNSKTMSENFSVRFLGINTPESTNIDEPWGHAASDFTKNRLENAKTIVLESEGPRTETYGRYLAFVWVDGVLLNLELVQEAYTQSTLSSAFKYYKIMMETSMKARATGRRFFGEKDRYYDYENHKHIYK